MTTLRTMNAGVSLMQVGAMAEQDPDDVLAVALARIHQLEQENLHLRNAADTFGLLAERLNQALQAERRVPAAPPDQTAQPAGVDRVEPRRIALWHLYEWRCEYVEENESRALRLYMGEQVVQSHHPRDMFDTLRQSAEWRGAVRSGPHDPGLPTVLAATPDRRSHQRRAVARGGRRTDDVAR